MTNPVRVYRGDVVLLRRFTGGFFDARGIVQRKIQKPGDLKYEARYQVFANGKERVRSPNTIKPIICQHYMCVAHVTTLDSDFCDRHQPESTTKPVLIKSPASPHFLIRHHCKEIGKKYLTFSYK